MEKSNNNEFSNSDYQGQLSEGELITISQVFESIQDNIIINPERTTSLLLSAMEKTDKEEKEELKSILLMVVTCTRNSDMINNVIDHINAIRD